MTKKKYRNGSHISGKLPFSRSSNYSTHGCVYICILHCAEEEEEGEEEEVVKMKHKKKKKKTESNENQRRTRYRRWEGGVMRVDFFFLSLFRVWAELRSVGSSVPLCRIIHYSQYTLHAPRVLHARAYTHLQCIPRDTTKFT